MGLSPSFISTKQSYRYFQADKQDSQINEDKNLQKMPKVPFFNPKLQPKMKLLSTDKFAISDSDIDKNGRENSDQIERERVVAQMKAQLAWNHEDSNISYPFVDVTISFRFIFNLIRIYRY